MYVRMYICMFICNNFECILFEPLNSAYFNFIMCRHGSDLKKKHKMCVFVLY